MAEVVKLGVILPAKVEHEYLDPEHTYDEHVTVPIDVAYDGQPKGTVTVHAYARDDGAFHVQQTWAEARGCPECEDGCVLCDDSVTVEELRDRLREAYRAADK